MNALLPHGVQVDHCGCMTAPSFTALLPPGVQADQIEAEMSGRPRWNSLTASGRASVASGATKDKRQQQGGSWPGSQGDRPGSESRDSSRQPGDGARPGSRGGRPADSQGGIRRPSSSSSFKVQQCSQFRGRGSGWASPAPHIQPVDPNPLLITCLFHYYAHRPLFCRYRSFSLSRPPSAGLPAAGVCLCLSRRVRGERPAAGHLPSGAGAVRRTHIHRGEHWLLGL